MATTGSTNGSFMLSPLPLEVAKTANYQVLVTDNNTLFTNTGAGAAVVFTLPAIAAGLCFEFLAVADFAITVASLAGSDLVWINDAAANSLAFSTSGEIIGGWLRVQANAAGTKWYVSNQSTGVNGTGGNTITVAT